MIFLTLARFCFCKFLKHLFQQLHHYPTSCCSSGMQADDWNFGAAGVPRSLEDCVVLKIHVRCSGELSLVSLVMSVDKTVNIDFYNL